MHGGLTTRDITQTELHRAITRMLAAVREYREAGEPHLADIREQALNRLLDRIPRTNA